MCHLILFLPFFALPVFWFFPFQTALTVYLIVLGISLFLYFKVFQAMRMKPKTGREAMLGKTGLVIKDIAPEGKIRYATEIWNAMTDGRRFSAGEKVIIYEILGGVVRVKDIGRGEGQD